MIRSGSGRHTPARIRLALAIGAALLGPACGIISGPALAQDERAQPAPAVVTDIRLVSESATESKFRLVFSPRANTFGPVGAGSGKASVGFALTTRGNGAVSPPNLKGIVRQLSFDQEGTVLIVHFATTAPAKVSAAAIDSTTVEVTVSNGVEQAGKTANAAPRGPLPAAPEPGPGESYELVMLRYADVSEVVGLLSDGLTVKSNDTFVPREPGFGSTSLTGGTYSPGPIGPAGGQGDPLGQSVDSALAVDRRLNAIWLKGTPDHIARMKAQIELIDVPVDSVILETQLVELDENAASAIGIDFTNANGQLAVVTAQSGQFIANGNQANSGSHLNAAGNIVGGHLTSAALQMAISAQINKGKGKIVSRPRIVAQSGGTAKIITGEALPILTAITLSGVNGVSQQVQYVNVGVTLQIAPRVSTDGFVTSHVFCVVSSETGTSQGYPTISQREAETMVTVKDGETFVIGGLTQDSAVSNDAKVPILGDVPIIGQIFHNKSATKQRTELYIVVTPHILRHPAAGVTPQTR